MQRLSLAAFLTASLKEDSSIDGVLLKERAANVAAAGLGSANPKPKPKPRAKGRPVLDKSVTLPTERGLDARKGELGTTPLPSSLSLPGIMSVSVQPDSSDTKDERADQKPPTKIAVCTEARHGGVASVVESASTPKTAVRAFLGTVHRQTGLSCKSPITPLRPTSKILGKENDVSSTQMETS